MGVVEMNSNGTLVVGIIFNHSTPTSGFHQHCTTPSAHQRPHQPPESKKIGPLDIGDRLNMRQGVGTESWANRSDSHEWCPGLLFCAEADRFLPGAPDCKLDPRVC
jgi:hypothetical protein